MNHQESDKTFNKFTFAMGVIGVILCALPFYASIVPPMTDISQHLLVAQIVSHYDNPSFNYSEYFTVDWSFAPTTIFYVLLVPLQMIAGPYWGVRIILLLWVMLIWLGIWSLAKSRNKREPWLVALVALPVIFSWYTYKGYLPFLMSYPLFLFSIAIWFKEKNPVQKIPLLWVLLILLFGFHIVGAAAACAVIVMASLTETITKRQGITQFGLSLVTVLPVPILLAIFMLSGNRPGMSIEYSGLIGNVVDTLKFTLTTLADNGVFIMFAWSLLLGIVFIVSIKNRAIDTTLLVCAITLIIIAVAMPTSMGSLWPAGPRLLPFALMLFVIALPWDKFPSKLVIGSSLVLLVFLSALTIRQAVHIDKGFKDFLGGIEVIEPGKNILPVLENQDQGSKWVDPYRNLISYYTIEKGGSHPYIFATPHILTGAAPLFYKRESDRKYAFLYESSKEAADYAGVSEYYDYVLLWGKSPALEEVIGREMKKIYTQGVTSIYSKK